MTYTCIRCGKQFEAKHKTAVCPECHTAVCVVCGKEFELKHPYNAKTCSTKCRSIYIKESGIGKTRAAKSRETAKKNGTDKPTYIKVCLICGKQFETKSARQMYCNDKHFGKCPVCGKPVEIKSLANKVPTCSEECKIKLTEQTCLEKYGNICVINSEHGQKKSNQTCIERYGVDKYSKSNEFKKQFRETCQERYGATAPRKNSEINERAIQTSILKYGGRSPTCSSDVRDKCRATSLSKYGGIGTASPIIRERIFNTNRQRYGSISALSNPDVRKKIVHTIREKYGVDYATQNAEVQAKTRNTNIERYGTSCVLNVPEFREKATQTLKSRYGVSNPFQAESIKLKIKQHYADIYGVTNPMQIQHIRDKAKQTCLDKYGAEYWGNSDIAIKSRMTDDSKFDLYLAFKRDAKEYIRNNYAQSPTLTKLFEDLGITLSTVSVIIIQQNAQDYVNYRFSHYEESVVDYIKSILPNVEIQLHNRNIISPYEIDIYLPQYHLGIECNPTITHNSTLPDPWSKQPKPYNYHKIKSQMAETAGIFLFHIFGYEWNSRKSVIQSMLANLLGCSAHKVYARNTYVQSVDFSTATTFLQVNHRQGSTSAKLYLGLYDKKTDELLSVMSFNHLRRSLGRIEFDSDVWELSRFCNVLNTNVVGGASKLLKHFICNYNPTKIISFSDIAHTKGDLYSTLGFTKVSESAPGYVWVDLSTDAYLHRVKCQKWHISKLFPNEQLDLTQTEKQIMSEHGYVQVFDSGVIRWELLNSKF